MRTVIIDNFFENAKEIREFALSQEFFPRSGNLYWEGHRTDNLKGIHPESHEQLGQLLVNAYYGHDVNAEITGHSHFHYNTVDDMYNPVYRDKLERIHVDDEEYTAIVYLTPYPESGSGIYLYDGDEPSYIQNRYNRLVMFPAKQIPHSIGTLFGKDKYDARLTLLYFFNSIDIKS